MVRREAAQAGETVADRPRLPRARHGGDSEEAPASTRRGSEATMA
jgi:hypothetical protein